MRMVIPILVLIGFYLSGVGLIFLGFHLRRRAQQFLATSVEVLGTVACMEQMRESGTTFFAPLVSYKDHQGRLYTVRRSYGTVPPPCDVGAAWPVFFQAADPHKAKPGPRQEIFRPSQTCFVAGVILLIFGTGVFLIPYSMTP